MAATLNVELPSLSAPQVRRKITRFSPLAAHVAEVVSQMLEESDGVSVEEVFTDGIANVLEQPEFAHSAKLRGARCCAGRTSEQVPS